MSKFIPYILIIIAVSVGFYLKHHLAGPELEEQNYVKDVKMSTSGNKIDNRFESLLIYPKKNPLADFSLIDQANTQFTNNDFKGYWNLIFTGYTNCPDVCPNTLTQMTQLYNLMDQQTRSKFQIIFFSVDPARDTPAHLNQYLDYFHQNFIGISGQKSQIDLLIRSLGGIYSLNEQEGEFYTVDHSARIFIVSPNAERYGILDSTAIKSEDKSQIVRDLTEMAK